MKRTLIALFAVMSLAAVALASSLPQSGTVVVSNDSGVQVGTGVIDNGKLTLTLDPGTSGLVTVTVTSSTGETESYQAMIDSSGNVTVVHDGTFEKLDDYAKSSGIDQVEVSESAEKTSSSSDTSSSSEDAKCPDPSQSGTATMGTSTGTSDTASCDDTSSTESASDSSSSNETESSSEDSVKVGVSVGNDSSSSSTDTSGDVKDSSDD